MYDDTRLYADMPEEENAFTMDELKALSKFTADTLIRGDKLSEISEPALQLAFMAYVGAITSEVPIDEIDDDLIYTIGCAILISDGGDSSWLDSRFPYSYSEMREVFIAKNWVNLAITGKL